jgi:hypothetical protein
MMKVTCLIHINNNMSNNELIFRVTNEGKIEKNQKNRYICCHSLPKTLKPPVPSNANLEEYITT